MATFRLVRLYLPACEELETDDLFEDREVLTVVRDANYPDKLIVDLLVKAEHTETVVDEFAERFGERDGFQAIVAAVEGVLRRPDDDESESDKDKKDQQRGGLRVSREELDNALSESLGINRVFLAMVVLSAVVAALGLVRDELAVVIGAMVIAPLLGPNIAISLAVTLGDLKLLRKAALTSLVGLAVALGVSYVLGLLLEVDPGTEIIAKRSQVELSHFGLALGAGAAGSIAFTRGIAGSVVGVMVAVALLPPLVASGLLLGSGETRQAAGAALLTLVNVLSIHLAGTVTFLVQGVRPRTWWDEDRAKKTTRIAMALMLLLLASLGAAVYYANAEAP